jgi:DNA-binding transcriptional LysR family regulator
MLLAGLGWGNMPAHLVEEDIARGRVKVIHRRSKSEIRADTADEWRVSLEEQPGMRRASRPSFS